MEASSHDFPGSPDHPGSREAVRGTRVVWGTRVAKIAGSGPGGAVTLGAVEKSVIATAAPAAPPAPARDRAASMRLAIAAAMARSNREIPHYYLAAEIDMSRALAWLRRPSWVRRTSARAPPWPKETRPRRS